MKELPLTFNQVALVDDEDFEWLNQWKWTAAKRKDGKFYVKRNENNGGKGKTIYLHRFITGASSFEEVDHHNGETLDYRRGNLRVCNKSQNQANRGIPKSNTSGYKGVFFDKRRGSWVASIEFEKKRYHLGSFSTPELAAQAYNLKAEVLHGEFARLNIIPELEAA